MKRFLLAVLIVLTIDLAFVGLILRAAEDARGESPAGEVNDRS